MNCLDVIEQCLEMIKREKDKLFQVVQSAGMYWLNGGGSVEGNIDVLKRVVRVTDEVTKMIKLLREVEGEEEVAMGVVSAFSSVKKHMISIVRGSEVVSMDRSAGNVRLLLKAVNCAMRAYVRSFKVVCNAMIDLKGDNIDLYVNNVDLMYEEYRLISKLLLNKMNEIYKLEKVTTSESKVVCDTNIENRPHSYNIAFRDFPRDVISECRAAALSETAMIENPDIIYACARFMCGKLFDDNYPRLHSIKVKPERHLVETGRDLVMQSDKKIKKIFKGEQYENRGAFGNIYVARSIMYKKKVAIKKVVQTERDKPYNYLEVAYLKLTDHPNIVDFLEAHDVDNPKTKQKELWIVMEYLQGGTLGETASRQRLSEGHIAYISREILRALSYLHTLNYVHRDLKSANVMLSITGQVKLIDFGLCGDLSEGPQTRIMGSPYWVPPEMILGLPHSYNADIYSTGVCILELLNLKPPYSGKPIKCMFTACTEGLTSQIPFSASDNAKDFISQALTIDAQKRPNADDLLHHPWVSAPSLDQGFTTVMESLYLSTAFKAINI